MQELRTLSQGFTCNEATMLVRYRYLKENGIVNDRVALARSIERYGFPKPLALGDNTIAWHLDEVEKWLESRPRHAPKSGDKKLPAIVAEGAPIDV
jgi:predicted DNA-binding transcriptional regulator AlpA